MVGRAKLRQYLRTLPPNQAIEEILILYDRLPAVQDYFASRFEEERTQVFEKYRRQIDDEFAVGRREPKGRLSIGRRILREYKQIAAINEDVAALMLHYTSAVLQFIRSYGVYEQPFLAAVVAAFRDAVRLAAKHNFEVEMADRFDSVVADASDVSSDLALELRNSQLENGGT